MNQFSSPCRSISFIIKITIMSLFWASITKDNQTFAKILEDHKNKSQIAITIQYPTNTNFFLDKDMEYSNDISTKAYQEIQDSLEWSYKLPSFRDNISKRIDDYYVNRYNASLITYLYDKEENEEWYDQNDEYYNEYEDYEDYEVIEM